MLRLPAQRSLHRTTVGHQHGRIPLPAHPLGTGHWLSCHASNGVQNFLYGKARSRAQVEDRTFTVTHCRQSFYGVDMGVCQIHHVDVVAYAGAVRCRIVPAENTEVVQ